MGEQSPQRPAPTARSRIRDLLKTIRDAILEQWPWLKPAVRFLSEEAQGVRRGWFFFGLIALLIMGGGYWMGEHKANIKLSETQQVHEATCSALSNQIAELKGRLTEKDAEIQKLNTELIPWRSYSLQQYGTPLEEAERKLAERITQMEASNTLSALKISQLQQELQETKAKAAPNALIFDSQEIAHLSNSTIRVRLKFGCSKNQPLGVIQLVAALPVLSGQKILDFSPANRCSSPTYGESKFIKPDGTVAELSYLPLSATFACIDLVPSGPTKVQIQGNNDLQTFILDVE
jgi:hypothetical protein